MIDNPFEHAAFTRRISQLDPALLESIDRYLQNLLAQKSSALQQTHYFHGRHENIYLHQHQLADLQQLLDESVKYCAEILDVAAEQLSIGYWFNLMQPGDITTLHRHDDCDELISGVVYLKVPEQSGNLVLQPKGLAPITLSPIAGNYLFFDPRTPHSVSENLSDQHRLSIGMNLGLKQHRMDHPNDLL